MSSQAAPKQRKNAPKQTKVTLDCEAGIPYLVVPYKGREIKARIEGQTIQNALAHTWYAQAHRSKKNGKVTFYICATHVVGDKRLMLGLHYMVQFNLNGEIPEGFHVDHIDRDTLNNTSGNLRALPPQLNSFNEARVLNGASRYPCVCWIKASSKWRARMTIGKKPKTLAFFATEEEAAAKVLATLVKIHTHKVLDWAALAAEFFPGIPMPATTGSPHRSNAAHQQSSR
jgi:hypothetical protein